MGAVPAAGSEADTGGRRWLFAGAEFDERSFELRLQGEPVELERKPLEVLLHLLRHAGEIVTKEELLAAVWPGRILTDNSLPKSVSRIREVLGDHDQAVIKTVHGYGYRLVAPVEVKSSRATPALRRLELNPGDHPPLRPLWSLVQRLGGGGQGEVWLVSHDKTREERVYKFALDLAGLAAIKREITLNRFLRESLEDRDEFTRVLDWNLEEAPYYIELEHGAAGNLEAWAEVSGGLAAVPPGVRLEVVARVADALAAAHSVGVLHKDLKPSNVLIAPDRDGAPGVKLADFGSGGVLDPQRLEQLGITRLGFTRSVLQGQAAATAMYLAPEVMSGQPATVRADVYSLGVLLYQMVAGNLRQPLAPGWEQQVGDPLLREDIALAVAGDPAQRLADAAVLAQRLRTLEERRRQRAEEQAQKLRMEQEQRAATERARKAELALERLHARRQWMLTVVSVLIVGVSVSLGLYFEARRARNQAAAAAAGSQAVAEFLSRDMFAQVGAKPLRDLTVTEMVESAATSLDRRSQLLPEVSAQLHAAMGQAALAVENYELAERQLGQALDSFEQAAEAGSEASVTVAATLLGILKTDMSRVPRLLPRYEAILADGRARLGPGHPRVVTLQHVIAASRFHAGDWTRAATDMRHLLDVQTGANPSDPTIGVHQARLALMLAYLGDFATATDLARNGLKRLQERLGAGAPAAIEAQLVLAGTLIQKEDFERAQALLRDSEALARPWYPAADSPGILSIRALAGLLALRADRPLDAVAILEETIRRFEQSEWVRKVDPTAEYRSWLAEALARSGRPAEAREAMRKALAVAETRSGPRHPVTQHIRLALADLLRPPDPAEARRLLASVDRGVIDGLGADHPYAAQLHRLEGLLALDAADREAARRSLREALRIYGARYGAAHSFTRRARAELARADRA